MTGSHSRRRSWLTAAALATVLLPTGCGGSPRQDASEPKGTYKLEVADARFPSLPGDRRELDDVDPRAQRRHQGRAQRRRDRRDRPGKPGQGTAAFGQRVDDSRLSDPERPIWVVDNGPSGGDSAATNTWALGRLKAGETKEFRWKVTAVEPGSYTIKYRISPGLTGRARLASGGRTDGSFKVEIDDKPVPARVDDDGNVVRGEEPGASKG